MAAIQTRSQHRCFGGRMGYYSHASEQTGTQMNFAVFEPPQAQQKKLPALYFLAGLTCSEETFMVKAGAQRIAADLGLMLVTCDTSPRGLGHAGEDEDWDFGTGAGFYLDASAEPWDHGYRMGSYVNAELPALIEANFAAAGDRRGIFGHSMGGHGALVTALRNRKRWHSVSAFAPIANPCRVPWGQKAFGHYLGSDEKRWPQWDACELLAQAAHPAEILVDQGGADQFLERELSPGALQAAAEAAGQQLNYRLHAGYDHGYYFIQSFIEDHLRHHARALNP